MIVSGQSLKPDLGRGLALTLERVHQSSTLLHAMHRQHRDHPTSHREHLKLTLEEKCTAISHLMYDQIGYMRNGHVLCPETLVVVFLLRLRIGFGLDFRWLSGQHMDGVLISRVNVRLRCGHRDLDFVLVRTCFHDSEICRDFVVALRTP